MIFLKKESQSESGINQAAHRIICNIIPHLKEGKMGVQWLSGRVLDSRLRERGFEPHRRHCVVVLEQDTFILAKYWFNPGRPDPV